MLINKAQITPCTAFVTKYLLNEIPLPEHIVIIWKCTERPDHAVKRAQRIRDFSMLLVPAAALTPLVISKKPNTRVRRVDWRDKLSKSDDMHPTSDEKKTTYAHTVSIDVAEDVTADVKIEIESLHGVKTHAFCKGSFFVFLEKIFKNTPTVIAESMMQV